METVVQSAFDQLLIAIILGVLAILTVLARKLTDVAVQYLTQKIGLETFNFLKSYAMTTVKFIEQSPQFQGIVNAEKKEIAVDEIVKWCNQRNLPVNHELIDRLIEEAVKTMKS